MHLRPWKFWQGFGSDSFVIGLVGYRDRTARFFLGLSILLTTTISVLGAALFAFTVVGTGGGWPSVLAVTLTCVVYGLMIYMLDMSIVTAVRPRLLQVMARLLLAAFLSFIVGSQINVTIHRDLLTSSLQSRLEREEGGRIAKELADAQRQLARAEFFHKQQIDEVRDANERIVLFSGIRPEQRSRWSEAVSQLRQAEDALGLLVCAKPLEARGEPWERRCGIAQSNPLLATLQLRETRVRGPAMDCRPQSTAVVCRMERGIAEMKALIADFRRDRDEIERVMDPQMREVHLSNAQSTLRTLLDQKKATEDEIVVLRARIAQHRADEKALSVRAERSNAELHAMFWEVAFKSDRAPAIGAATVIWMWILIALTFCIDIFVLIAKLIWPSPIYDMTISEVEKFQQERVVPSALGQRRDGGVI
jgi:hypothetical protein